MQERADLEDEQFEFDKRLKSLRLQIRVIMFLIKKRKSQRRTRNSFNKSKTANRPSDSFYFCIIYSLSAFYLGPDTRKPF